MGISAAPSLAEQATAERDVRKRKEEREAEEIIHILKERGYDDHRAEDVVDRRFLAPLEAPKSKLELSASFVAHRETYRNSSSRASYLRGSSSLPSLKTPREDEPTPAELGQRRREAVHRRQKQLVADVHHDTAKRMLRMRLRLDDLGIFSPETNQLRALSVCRAASRRRVTMDELHSVAVIQVANGYKPPPTPIAGGEHLPTGPDLLKGRLERFDSEIARQYEQAPVAQQPQSMLGGSRRQGSANQRDHRHSGRSSLASGGSRRSANESRGSSRSGADGRPTSRASHKSTSMMASAIASAPHAVPASALGRPSSGSGVAPTGAPAAALGMKKSQSMPSHKMGHA